MIQIISGAINEGKTQAMKGIFSQSNTGDGFLSGKIFSDVGVFMGYELIRLSSGEKMPLAFKEEYIPSGLDEICRLGPFRFSGKAFMFAEQMIDEIIIRGVEPIFIDEIGPLELSGKGFYKLFTHVLSLGGNLVIAVRKHCVEDVISKFNIRDYRVITVEEVR
jgi:nucleoside-triphosphatase THEP1